MKIKLLAFFAVANLALMAQTTVERLTMGLGYANDIYYSLSNGEVSSVAKDNWHLSFTTEAFDVTIRTNTAIGMNLYVGSSDVNDWAIFDTTGMNWTPWRNSDKYWESGAFNAGATGHPDYGWGDYNMTTHNVVGTKIFVIEFPDGTFKKIIIEGMRVGGFVDIKIADLDGMNEVTRTIMKTDYPNQNFFYYNAKTDAVFSREPDRNTWDLIFTQYETELAPNVFYKVTGALKNMGTKASAAHGVDTNTVDWNMHLPKDTVMNVIGYDWKSFQGSWTLADSSAYFVQSHTGDLYKIVFKSWGGSGSGDMTFSKTLISTIGIAENPLEDLKVYPNPAVDFIHFDSNEAIDLEVLSLNGKRVMTAHLEAGEALNISHLRAGAYIIASKSFSTNFISKLIIQ